MGMGERRVVLKRGEEEGSGEKTSVESRDEDEEKERDGGRGEEEEERERGVNDAINCRINRMSRFASVRKEVRCAWEDGTEVVMRDEV